MYESEVAEKVKNTSEEYRETKDYKTSILSTATVLGLSKAPSHRTCLMKKACTFQTQQKKRKSSVGAERQRRYRAVRKLRTEPTEEHLWRWFFFMQVCASKRTQVYPLPMKYERAGMGNTLRNCGSIAERIVKAWRGVLCCWLGAILKGRRSS